MLIAGVFIGGYLIEHFFSDQYERNVLYYNTRISELGRVRNNLAYINYYTFELMLKPQDASYRRLLQN